MPSSRYRNDYSWYGYSSRSDYDYPYERYRPRSTADYDPYADYQPNYRHTGYNYHPHREDYHDHDRYHRPDYHRQYYHRDHSPRYPSRERERQREVELPPLPPSPSPPPPPPPVQTSPSPEYISLSLQPSTSVSDPSTSRKLLVLDLNGTLVYRTPHRPRQRRRFDSPQAHSSSSSANPYDAYGDPHTLRPLRTAHGRPYLPSFVNYVFHPKTKEWLDTMIWSSAQPHSVADMVERCFGERKGELRAVWARDTLGLDMDQYHKKTQTTKDLAKPWSSLTIRPGSAAAEETPLEHSACTTILLDDSPKKARLQPWNHLCIKEYDVEMRRTDLECWEAERRRALNVEIKAEVEEDNGETESIGTVDADTNANVPSPVEDPNHPIDGSPGKNKRKREKKKKRHGTPSIPTDSTTPLKPYDLTLLAIIGILDAAKSESNVAGWMRCGGVRVLSPSVSGGEDEVGVEESSVAGDEEARPQWFEDSLVLERWAERGRKACVELGVKVESGIVGG